VVLDFGKVIATGTPDAVQSDPVVTTAYLGAEIGGHDGSGGGDRSGGGHDGSGGDRSGGDDG